MTNSLTHNENAFLSDLVFGFDIGTASIGYAVRRGADFLDVGVLLCPDDAANLSKRRELRRQRRTLRSKKFRRQWFSKELASLGLAKPVTPPHDPISLRLRAAKGEPISPHELHAALAHLFKRRGYAEVPWANREPNNHDGEDVEGEVRTAVEEMRQKLGTLLPCEFLAKAREAAGNSPTANWARKIYWPREALEKEFRSIVGAQQNHYPQLASRADWLLYGDTQAKQRNGRTYRVFFSGRESRNPGVLGLRWPRFDNRGPALDAFTPIDADGRPVHVVRKNKDAFLRAQWELALMNFRVMDPATRQNVAPAVRCPQFIEKLRVEWDKKGKVTLARMRKLAEPFAGQFLLLDGQKPLTPETGSGRARYSSPTLLAIHDTVSSGRRIDPPQPLLCRVGETTEHALHRYLADIKHPLVRHRLTLYCRLLKQLVHHHGQPAIIVLEAVRSLALGEKAKREMEVRNEQFRKERETAREQLADAGESVSRKAIQRFRLWQEAHGRCPFCLAPIERTALGHGADIEHLVPRSLVDCNEFYNLTVAHIQCNRERKGNRTPFHAFGNTADWDAIKQNAESCFKGRKLEIFLSPDAELLVEQKADLQHTAYIARVIRHVSLLQLSWIGDDGRDPTIEKGNKPSSSFQVTNGQLTSRLRRSWGLNQILHPLPTGQRWEDLSEADQKRIHEKNRGDVRHHSLDAMVISCTLPWLAHRTHGATDEFGNHGWWTQDERERSRAANPVFPSPGQMHSVCREWMNKVVIRYHSSRSKHQQAYATTLYAKKAKHTYVAREIFTTLTPKNLASIYPKELADYCSAAWEKYAAESSDLEAELKPTRGCIPISFTRRLCFSHFQRWRAHGGGPFQWPDAVKIPILSVRLISVKDDSAVVPFSPGTHAYVKRTGFREVQIYSSADGLSLVPVFVPFWKGDAPIHDVPILPGAKPVAIIRRGMVVETKKPFSTGHPPGKYRVLVTGQKQLRLLPHIIANDPEAPLAFGLPKTGLQPYWPDFIRALGYEPPHPPPSQPSPPCSDQT